MRRKTYWTLRQLVVWSTSTLSPILLSGCMMVGEPPRKPELVILGGGVKEDVEFEFYRCSTKHSDEARIWFIAIDKMDDQGRRTRQCILRRESVAIAGHRDRWKPAEGLPGYRKQGCALPLSPGVYGVSVIVDLYASELGERGWRTFEIGVDNSFRWLEPNRCAWGVPASRADGE